MRCSPELHRRGSIVLLALVLLATSQPISARTWYVTVDGTGDVPTIRAAIDSVSPGDEIVVGPGRYTWANQGGGDVLAMIFVDRGRDDFTLRSETGPENTILDAQSQNRVIFIQGYNDIVVEGFTITGGVAPQDGYYDGGGLATHLSGDVIRNCVFENNSAAQGGGLWCGGVSRLTVESCTFRNNSADYGGAMLFINSHTRSTIRDCLVYDNEAGIRGGGVYGVNDNLTIENTVFLGNRAPGTSGGGLFLRTMWPSSISNCTLVQNESPVGAGLDLYDTPDLTIDRCIIAHQTGAAFAASSGGVYTVSCSDVFGNGSDAFPAGTIDLGGNFSADPMFCGLSAQNLDLSSSSPCAPGNHPDDAPCGRIGARDVSCGQVRTEAHSWGQVKALYR